MKELINNIDKIHTTEMGLNRIKKNLNLTNEDIVKYCKDIIIDSKCDISIEGKNYYCKLNDIIITVNKNSYTIITAHKR